MRFFRFLLLVVLLIMALVAADVYIETNFPILGRVQLETVKLPRGEKLKILQISDLHDKQFGKDDSGLLKLVGEAGAEMIVITGDMVDVKTQDFTHAFALAGKLIQMVPQVYFVQGNHEHWNDNEKIILNGLKAAGVKVLDNANSRYTKGNIQVNVCGIDYPYENVHGETRLYVKEEVLMNAFKGIDNSKYTVMLSHSPKIADDIKELPADLILSGHTHGGQIRLPFVGSVLKLDPDFFGKYDKGLFRLKSGTVLYVDSGLGTSIMPARLFDRAQVTLITVKGIGG